MARTELGPARRLLDRVGDGPVARAVIAHPWENTPVGSIDAWPDELRLLVQVMLTSQFPMLVVWGAAYTQLYNEAFRPILGSGKHPGALGASARDTWAEIWDEIGPLFAEVFDAGRSVWRADQRLLIDRNGYSEETFFTYSYSPIHDNADAVAGLLVVASETTPQVVDRRRLACGSALASALVGATTIQSVAKATVESLRNCADVVAVEINLVVADSVVRIASSRHPLTDAADREVVRRATKAETPVVLDRGWRPGRPARRVAFSVGDPSLHAVVVCGLNPHRAFDDEYREFVALIRQSIAASMTAALMRASEVGALREISETLQHAMLELASDLPTVAARYLPKASDLTVGGDWYEVLDLGGGRRALIVGDCVGHGLEAATAMGALRNVSRALLAEGRGPADVIDSLHGFAATMPAASCATVVCAVVDLPRMTVTYSNAGHPPPLLVHRDVAIWLDEALTTPLAVGRPSREEATVQITSGDLLVLYTDGLVERPGEIIDDGLGRLAAAVIETSGKSVQQIADSLIEELVDEDVRDDIAIVVKRVP